MADDNVETKDLKKSDSKSITLYTLFDPLRKCVTFFGFYVASYQLKKSNADKALCVLRWISTCVKILLLSIHIVCIYIRQLSFGFQIDTKSVWPLSECVWCTEALTSILYLIYWQKNNNIKNIAECLEKATVQSGLKKHYRKLQIQLKICLVGSVGFIAIVLISNAKSTFSIFSEYQNSKGIYFGLPPSFNFLSMIAVIYFSAGWCFTTILYGFLCKCLLTEFKNINDGFSEEIDFNAETLRKHLKIFSNMRCVVDLANSTFSTYIMWMLFCNVIVVVMTLYAILTSPFLGVGYIFAASWIVGAFIQIWALSWLPADVNDEAGKFGEAVYRKLNEEDIEPTSELYVMASSFVLRNLNCPIGIQVGRFFYVTKGLLLTIASLIISYLTLAIQSNPVVQIQNCVDNSTAELL